MSDSMIERVARAIVEANHRENPVVREWDRQDARGRRVARACAWAAIAAMREPTEEMIRAADNEASMDIWHDMIEAALDG